MSFSPAHTEPSVASFFISAPVLQTSWLEDFNLRMINFRLCILKWLKVFTLWIFGFRSKKPKWLKFRSMCGTLSVTWCQRTSEIWSIEVFAFHLRLYELLLGHFIIILVVLDLVLFVCGFFYSVYPLSFWDKNGEYYFWIGFVFLTSQVIFVPEWPKREFVSFIGYILLTKSLPCKVVALYRVAILFRVFRWKGP
jgi:hypothetical protein